MRHGEGRSVRRSLPFSGERLLEGGAPFVARGPALLLVSEGGARVAAAGRRFAAEARDLVVLPPGRGAAVEAPARCGLLVLRFDEEVLAAAGRLLPEREALAGLGAVLAESGGTVRRASAEAAELSAILDAAARAQAAPTGPGDDSLAALALAELLVRLSRLAARALSAAGGEGGAAPSGRSPARGAAASAVSGAGAEGSPWSIGDALRHVEERYAESFSLDFFVSRCAMNTSDFSRRFKAAAGYPLFEYINRLRVRRACSLLKESELPIIEVALAVGYNNLSFFNRYFLRITRQTPREYRAASRR